MDDNVSIKSSDSLTTSGEYEIVPEIFDGCCSPISDEPQRTIADAAAAAAAATGSSKPLARSPMLNIANNGDFREMEKNLIEVISELDIERADWTTPPMMVTGDSTIVVGQGKGQRRFLTTIKKNLI